MKRIAIYLFFSLVIIGKAYANIYYVSNAGSNDNNGLTKDTPLKTLTAAAGKVSPGDVILLRRGDVFRESVEITKKNIEVNAYGPSDGALPVISGAVPLTGFQPFRGNIYVAEIDAEIGYLFVDKELMTIARYPNEGWLRTKYWEDTKVPRGATEERLSQPNTMVQCEKLSEYPNNRDDFWIGANIRWRHHSWWFETREVVDYKSSGKLFLSDRSFSIKGPHEGMEKGWGFYLDDKLELLDTAGEWFFDKRELLVTDCGLFFDT